MLPLLLIKHGTAMTAFTASFMLVNNSVPVGRRGTMNGLAMMTSSMGKAVGPIVGGTLFAWSIADSEHPFPLNRFATFVLVALGNVLIFAGALKLPERLNRPFEDAVPACTGGSEATAPAAPVRKRGQAQVV